MRTIVIAGLLVFGAAGAAYAADAADDSLDRAAKKTANGFGELLKGMGQEIKKSGIISEPKKDDKKEAPKKDETKGKEDRK